LMKVSYESWGRRFTLPTKRRITEAGYESNRYFGVG